jgi:2-amino-4-hydroxy-6-hydroxymethyldihydropteridine diphosphokinase
MESVYLGLGANTGEARLTLRAAISELGRVLDGLRVSLFYRSAPRYYVDQPDFVNAVVEGQTGLSPRGLLAAVNGIEAEFGRDRSREIFKGPRPLDIDILLFGSLMIVEEDLVIPHAALRERKFALLPLVELSPGLIDPVGGERFASILAALPPQGIYLLESADYDLLYL